jgi:hypothetical protein
MATVHSWFLEKYKQVFRVILTLPCTQTSPLYPWHWSGPDGQIFIYTHEAAGDVPNPAQAGDAEAMNHRKHSCHNFTSQQTTFF